MTIQRSQPANDCNITPLKFWATYVLYIAGLKLLLIYGVIS